MTLVAVMALLISNKAYNHNNESMDNGLNKRVQSQLDRLSKQEQSLDIYFQEARRVSDDILLTKEQKAEVNELVKEFCNKYVYNMQFIELFSFNRVLQACLWPDSQETASFEASFLKRVMELQVGLEIDLACNRLTRLLVRHLSSLSLQIVLKEELRIFLGQDTFLSLRRHGVNESKMRSMFIKKVLFAIYDRNSRLKSL